MRRASCVQGRSGGGAACLVCRRRFWRAVLNTVAAARCRARRPSASGRAWGLTTWLQAARASPCAWLLQKQAAEFQIFTFQVPGLGELRLELLPSGLNRLPAHSDRPSSRCCCAERYARALSSAGNAGQVPPTIEITTPDGRWALAGLVGVAVAGSLAAAPLTCTCICAGSPRRTHSCTLGQLGKDRRWYLGHVRELLRCLAPVAAGDQLRFMPMRRGAASVVVARNAGAPQALRSGSGPPSPWRGLEPTDRRRYTVPVASVLKARQLGIPGVQRAALFA